MALSNSRLLVLYDVPAPNLWHERMVMDHVEGEEYVVATPDQDVYVEELPSSDFRAGNAFPIGLQQRMRPREGLWCCC